MTRFSITRRIQFCAGHRVPLHESKCRHLHGHNYVALIHASAESLDQAGRVIDFGVLKEIVGGWIDQFWDHGFIVQQNDEATLQALFRFDDIDRVGQKIYRMQSPPTAECMAQELFEVCQILLKETGVVVDGVTLYETENCYAQYPANCAPVSNAGFLNS